MAPQLCILGGSGRQLARVSRIQQDGATPRKAMNDNVTTMEACDFCGAQPSHEPQWKFIENPRIFSHRAIICEGCVAIAGKYIMELHRDEAEDKKTTEAPAASSPASPEDQQDGAAPKDSNAKDSSEV